MKNDDLRLIVEEIGSACIASHIKYKHKDLYSNIIKYTDNITRERKFKFSERLYLYINDMTEIPKCKICNLPTKYLDYTRGYQDTCSRKCSNSDPERIVNIQKTCKERYGHITATGTKTYNEKVKETCLKKYGAEHHLSKGSKLRKRINKTNNDKYGGNSPFCDKNVQKKWREEYKNKHGVDHPWKDQKVRKRITKDYRYKFYNDKILNFDNIIPNFNVDEYINLGFGYINIYSWKCKKCGDDFESYYANGNEPTCPKCYPKYRSKSEIELYDFIKHLDVKIKSNVRSLIKGYEFDIVLPELKLCIEFNGNYYHSELAGKDKHYHLKKTEHIENIGYHLIHIFEDEWIYKKKIIKSKIKSLLNKQKYNIYARKCIIKEINNNIKNAFLNKYHIQGTDKSNIKLGLFYKDRLVGVMTFCKARKILNNKDSNLWELSRYATISNFNIVGGGSKLLKHFINMNICNKIISYADRRFSNISNNIYNKIGFVLDHISPPNYYYINCNNYLERLSRIKFQKHKLDKILNTYDNKKSEWENMKSNKFNRIWDCGNLVYILYL